ncbi:MAG: hypothetical protein AAF543_21195, partial [Pseudomonadota bacterium]
PRLNLSLTGLPYAPSIFLVHAILRHDDIETFGKSQGPEDILRQATFFGGLPLEIHFARYHLTAPNA